MDSLKLVGLRYRVKLGVLPEEQALGNEIRLDIELRGYFRQAGDTDDIAYAVDYRNIVDSVTHFSNENSFHLVEAYAEKLAARLLSELNGVKEIEITVRKQQPPLPVILDGVEVTIKRGKI